MILVRSWVKAKADSPNFTVRNPLETKTYGNELAIGENSGKINK